MSNEGAICPYLDPQQTSGSCKYICASYLMTCSFFQAILPIGGWIITQRSKTLGMLYTLKFYLNINTNKIVLVFNGNK